MNLRPTEVEGASVLEMHVPNVQDTPARQLNADFEHAFMHEAVRECRVRKGVELTADNWEPGQGHQPALLKERVLAGGPGDCPMAICRRGFAGISGPGLL